jgi:hypothetical protein
VGTTASQKAFLRRPPRTVRPPFAHRLQTPGAGLDRPAGADAGDIARFRQTKAAGVSREWLFCGIKVGAEYESVIQSLLSTCRVQGINPYTYLVDVLQRIDTHPARDVASLTPRLWKEHFAGSPLRSDIDRNH